MTFRQFGKLLFAIAITLSHTAVASAVVLSGPGGSGVTAGSSSLIPVYHYSDSWTVGPTAATAARQAYGPQSYPLPAGVEPVESTYLSPPASWNPGIASIATDASNAPTGGSPYPGSSGAGSATGFTQTGTPGFADFGLAYGLSNNFIVQFDTLLSGDRVNIFTGSGIGNFGAANSIAAFFRSSASANPQIGVYIPGVGEVNTTLSSGLSGAEVGKWHNFAVQFDIPNTNLTFFVDETSRGSFNYSGVALGYAVSNASVSIGSAGHGDRLWTDNFQVRASVPPPGNLPNPGPIVGLPAELVSYWDFNEADGPVPGFSLNYAYDRKDGNHGAFEGTATRVPGAALGNGLVGLGAAAFDNQGATAVNVGAGTGNNFSVSTGITVEALVVTGWSGASGDYDEIFRKEDGGSRILLSYQNDNAAGPVLGFGLNVNGIYSELDMPLDGSAGITLAQLEDGFAHHIAATYDSVTSEKAIWIDGVLRFSENLGAGNLITSGGGAPAFIGGVNGGETFTGIIDEVAFWTRALSGSEVATHFSNTLAGNNYFVPEPGTLAMFMISALGLAAVFCRRAKK